MAEEYGSKQLLLISDTHGRLGIISEPAVNIRADAANHARGPALVLEKGGKFISEILNQSDISKVLRFVPIIT
jgi:hypothetical protein